MPAAPALVSTPSPTDAQSPAPVGIGLKAEHVGEVLAQSGAGCGMGFFEVHAENYMVDGGPFLAHLEAVRSRYALSLHGVGLSIGGSAPLDSAHLARLKALVQRFQPQWFSEHLAWSSHGGTWLNDLLPLPYNAQTLAQVCRHIDQAQSTLGRTLLLENPATYVEFSQSTLTEADFLSEVARRTGCGLLLDVNNAYVNATNHGGDALAFIQALPAAAVGEIHLAGFAEDTDDAGQRLLIDHHGAAVDAQVWALYQHTLATLGPRPTLIERDNNVPTFSVLRAEALQAAAAMHSACADVCTQA